MIAAAKAPYIDWEALSPVVALAGGACIVLLVGLLRGRFMRRQVVPFLTLVVLGVTAGLCIWQWDTDTRRRLRRAGDRRPDADVDNGVRGGRRPGAVLLSWRSGASAEVGGGEYFALMLGSVARHDRARRAPENLVAVFLGFELLSIPLYVLCATRQAREPRSSRA